MFQSFQRYRRILVTGPMRSGTTICAAMIARDAGKTLVREESMFQVWPFDAELVVQAPVLLPEAKRLGFAGWFVVVMQRDPLAVIASVKKFMEGRLDAELAERMAREQISLAEDLGRFVEDVGPGQVVRYEELRAHPMWVEDRSGFGPRDISTTVTDRNLRKNGDASVYM